MDWVKFCAIFFTNSTGHTARFHPFVIGLSSGFGVDVMIAIFCDFCQFSAKFFLIENQCYDPNFA
jgi:hypothetical protein